RRGGRGFGGRFVLVGHRMRAAVADHRQVAGQLGHRDAPAAAPSPATAGRRLLAVPGQQLRHRHLLGILAHHDTVSIGPDFAPSLSDSGTVLIVAPGTATTGPPFGSVSSLRRLSPSRIPHGQISMLSSDNARILASATSAPATSCCDRSALTPSNSARSEAVILEMNAIN